jgi:hypothetical protein
MATGARQTATPRATQTPELWGLLRIESASIMPGDPVSQMNGR